VKDGFGLTPERLLRVLVVVTVLVTIGYLVAFVAVHLFDANPRGRAVRLLSMASERNIPTWFHSVLIFSNGLLMGLLAWDKRRFHEYGVAYWAGLAVVFMFLSLDEMSSIHEMTHHTARNLIHAMGVTWELKFAWVLVYLPLTMLLAAVYLRFLLRIEREMAAMFVVSGALYVGATVGLETLGGQYLGGYLSDGEPVEAIYDLIGTAEETVESIAMVLLFWSLTRYAARHCPAAGQLFRE